MTNLIITSSLEIGFYSSALFLVFQVSIKSWKGNFSCKSQKLIFKDKKYKWPFFSIFTPNLLLQVCRPIILTVNKFFLEFHWLFRKFKEIITNVVFFGSFVSKIFAHSKKSVPKWDTCASWDHEFLPSIQRQHQPKSSLFFCLAVSTT